MRFHYISPSLLPSRAANAVHVVQQCDALSRMGAEVTLYAKRTVPDEAVLVSLLTAQYEVDASSWRMMSYYSEYVRADTLRIAALALADIRWGQRPDAILSRNLYAAFSLAVLQRRPLIFETHQLELGVRKAMQRAIMTRPWVTTVAISQSLVHHLTRHHGVPPSHPLVLHDAAPKGMQPVSPEFRRKSLAGLVPEAVGTWQATCAYFGHLYPGRGIEIIEAMAEARPGVLFLVFGGNDADVAQRRGVNTLSNLFFIGHLPHAVARQVMVVADILLMPYQDSVSIGVAGHDTARWMSPMKMFEYLAAGVPIISSSLPVLCEVLEDERNALLVHPSDPDAWVSALDRLVADPVLSLRLGDAGHADYLAHYTWDQRASALLAAAHTF